MNLKLTYQNVFRFLTVKITLGMLCLVGILGMSGCGDGNPPPQPTTGQLFINGVAAEGAVVSLHPIGGNFDKRGTCPSGRVGADGSFTLSTYALNDGVPAGDYAVTIVWSLQPGNPEAPDRLGRQYVSPQKSPLKITIKEGENTLEPIRLDKVKMLKGSRRR